MKKNSELEPCSKGCAYCFIHYTDVLLNNSLFNGVKKNTIGNIIKNTHHRVKKLEKGEVYAVEGDPLNNLVIILEGSVLGELMDLEGNMLTVEQRTASQSVALAFLFGKNNKFPVTVTANEKSMLLLIPREQVLKMLAINEDILKNFLDIISGRAQFLSQRIKILGIQGLKKKLVYYLLENMKLNGTMQFSIPHTQQQLAEQFASTRPSVGRMFRELHNEGYIISKGKYVTILNHEGMKTLMQ